jgi:hypothetical protein
VAQASSTAIFCLGMNRNSICILNNQLKMARLKVRLVNNGINVFITTHSDYIIKEFNNLLGLLSLT